MYIVLVRLISFFWGQIWIGDILAFSVVFGGGNVHFVGECVQFGKQNVHLMWRNFLSLASW